MDRGWKRGQGRVDDCVGDHDTREQRVISHWPSLTMATGRIHRACLASTATIKPGSRDSVDSFSIKRGITLLNRLSLRPVPPCHLRSRLTFVTYQPCELLYSYLSIFPWWRQATECENERRRGMLSTVAG